MNKNIAVLMGILALLLISKGTDKLATQYLGGYDGFTLIGVGVVIAVLFGRKFLKW